MHILKSFAKPAITLLTMSPVIFGQDAQYYRSVKWDNSIIYFDDIKIKNNIYSIWQRRDGAASILYFNKKHKTISLDGKTFDPIAPDSNAEYIFSSLDSFVAMRDIKIPIFKKLLNPLDNNSTRIYIDTVNWFTPGFAYIKPTAIFNSKANAKFEFWLIHWEQSSDGDFHDLILNSYDKSSNLIATIGIFRTRFDKSRLEDTITHWGIVPESKRKYEPIKPESVTETAIRELLKIQKN